MTASNKPCRYCGDPDVSARQHHLDDGTGDHGYAPEQFPGDRATRPLTDAETRLPVLRELCRRARNDALAEAAGHLASLGWLAAAEVVAARVTP